MKGQHPNATASGLISALAVVLVAVLAQADIELPAEAAAALVGGAVTLVLAIGRRGKKRRK